MESAATEPEPEPHLGLPQISGEPVDWPTAVHQIPHDDAPDTSDQAGLPHFNRDRDTQMSAWGEAGSSANRAPIPETPSAEDLPKSSHQGEKPPPPPQDKT